MSTCKLRMTLNEPQLTAKVVWLSVLCSPQQWIHDLKVRLCILQPRCSFNCSYMHMYMVLWYIYCEHTHLHACTHTHTHTSLCWVLRFKEDCAIAPTSILGYLSHNSRSEFEGINEITLLPWSHSEVAAHQTQRAQSCWSWSLPTSVPSLLVYFSPILFPPPWFPTFSVTPSKFSTLDVCTCCAFSVSCTSMWLALLHLNSKLAPQKVLLTTTAREQNHHTFCTVLTPT